MMSKKNKQEKSAFCQERSLSSSSLSKYQVILSDQIQHGDKSHQNASVKSSTSSISLSSSESCSIETPQAEENQ